MHEALPAPTGLPCSLKILAAVAAPDDAKTQSAPLDVEAEMQAVLDAVSDVPGGPAQVRILEVASLPQIRKALENDAFHVLHLSAHGSAESVELEDEDGNPVQGDRGRADGGAAAGGAAGAADRAVVVLGRIPPRTRWRPGSSSEAPTG